MSSGVVVAQPQLWLHPLALEAQPGRAAQGLGRSREGTGSPWPHRASTASEHRKLFFHVNKIKSHTVSEKIIWFSDASTKARAPEGCCGSLGGSITLCLYLLLDIFSWLKMSCDANISMNCILSVSKLKKKSSEITFHWFSLTGCNATLPNTGTAGSPWLFCLVMPGSFGIKFQGSKEKI